MDRIRRYAMVSYQRRRKPINTVIVALVLVLILYAFISKVSFLNIFSFSVSNTVRRQVAKALIFEPSQADYNLKEPEREDFSRGLSKIVDKIIGEKTDGFYVDIGAGDGETNSVSLYFERKRNYQGILVEGNTDKFKQLMNKNRKAQKLQATIKREVMAFPLSSMEITPSDVFEMIDRKEIDILIINLHDHEFEFLKSIDLDNYQIKIITVEFQVSVSDEKYSLTTDYLIAHGYRVAHHLISGHLDKKDVVYSKV